MTTTAHIRPDSLVDKLNDEWSSRYATVEHDFGLPERFTGDELLAALRGLETEQRDELLYQMLCAAHSGNRAAERALVQTLIPVACRMGFRVRYAGRSLANNEWGERASLAVVAGWESIRGYKLHLTKRVWANLTMGMLGALTPPRGRSDVVVADNTECVTDETLIELAGAAQVEQAPEVQLANLFAWAVDTGVVTRDETALLSRVALGDQTQHEIAAELGTSEAALRMRVIRIRKRISAAVREHY